MGGGESQRSLSIVRYSSTRQKGERITTREGACRGQEQKRGARYAHYMDIRAAPPCLGDPPTGTRFATKMAGSGRDLGAS
jgi:hypothetical protein